MKSKSQYNESYVYDASADEREASTIEPRFGRFLLSVAGTGHRVLDVGCGTGRYTIHTEHAGNDVVGIELVFNAARGARARGLDVAVVDSENVFPFPDATFDRVQCIEVIEHLMDPVTTLREIHRVLRSDGELFISTPNAAWWAHRTLMAFGVPSFGHSAAYPTEVNMHIRHFSMKTLTRFLEKSGFEVVRRQGTYTGFPGALAEYAPRPVAAILNGISAITRGLGFLAKQNLLLSVTSAGLVLHARKQETRRG